MVLPEAPEGLAGFAEKTNFLRSHESADVRKTAEPAELNEGGDDVCDLVQYFFLREVELFPEDNSFGV